MEITSEMIDDVAALAKLNLTEAEKIQAKQDLEQILGYMEKIQELDTDTTEPLMYVLPQRNVFREDIEEPGTERELILSNAPEQKDGCFLVPKTVE